MTAYEMRISDWSSDVCSSDLPGTRPGILERLMVIAEPFRDLAKFGVHLQRHVGGGHHRRHTSARIMGIGGHILFFLIDRTSVVLGKSVSVRVDLGGRRIITKII